LLAEHFEAARRWVDYVHRHNPNLVWEKNRHNDYNDWLNGNWVKQTGWPSQGGSVSNTVFATAFFAHSTDLVSKMAAVLGRHEDGEVARGRIVGEPRRGQYGKRPAHDLPVDLGHEASALTLRDDRAHDLPDLVRRERHAAIARLLHHLRAIADNGRDVVYACRSNLCHV
jgi:alpha-L-rhamnosidase